MRVAGTAAARMSRSVRPTWLEPGPSREEAHGHRIADVDQLAAGEIETDERPARRPRGADNTVVPACGPE
jgi:hypothetical protein